MEKLETQNVDLLLQRRSLEFILDDTLKDLTDSLRKIECSFQLIRELQNQCQRKETHFSSQQNRVSNLEQKVEEDKTNASRNTALTYTVSYAAGVAAPLLLMSGPVGWITAGVGLVKTIQSTSEAKRQGEMLIDEDKNLLREATGDLEDSGEKIKEIRRNIKHEEKLQDISATTAEVELIYIFLAPTGALEEAILYVHVCVRHFPQKNTANEFLKHSKESRGVLGQAGKQAGK